MLFPVLGCFLVLLRISSTLGSPFQNSHDQVVRRQAATSSTLSAAQLLSLNIGVDIMAQQGQIAAVEMIQQMQQGGIVDAQAFNATKGSLMSLISTSIAIRGNSQKLAGNVTAVIPGLAQLEESQVQGFILANQLSGDAATDSSNLDRLKSAFQANIAMNQELQAKANGGSATSSSSTTSTLSM